MKTIQLEGIGAVTLKKSKRAKRVIAKITPSGEAVVVVPYYLPFKTASLYARQFQGWFSENKPKEAAAMPHGLRIGKSHILQFTPANLPKPQSRVSETTVTVKYPTHLTALHPAAQAEAQKGAGRALKRQAETRLPALVHEKAREYGYSYREVRIKQMSSRWGSCSSNKIVNLSIWLMQLPDELIEYVICHELTHLRHMNHSPAFWSELALMLPHYKELREQLKAYSPRLMQA